MFKVVFIPDYANVGAKYFTDRDEAESFANEQRQWLFQEWLKKNEGKSPEHYYVDPHTVDVQCEPCSEPVDIYALWDLHDCDAIPEPARSELWDAISSLQRANFTEDEIVYQIESFLGEV